MARNILLAGIVGLGLASGPVLAQSADQVAAKFGARESVRSISISPEGKQIVIVGPRSDGGENAVVVDLATAGAVPVFSAKGRTEQITHCQFILETRVVCEAYFNEGSNRDIAASTRLVSLTSDGKDMKVLSAPQPFNAYFSSRFGGGILDYTVPGDPASVLMTRWFSPEQTTGKLTARTDSGLGVERVNVLTGARKVVVPPRESASGFVSDGNGNVRLMVTQPARESGYVDRKINYLYRDAAEGGWNPLGSAVFDGGRVKGFSPVAVDGTRNVVYGFDDNNGFLALYERALDGIGTTRLVLAHPGTEVDGLMQIGRKQRVIGASFASDRRYAEYFDPELGQLTKKLAKALGGDKQLSIIDASADESRLIIFAASDTDPGQYYLYDKATHKLGGLMPNRPDLEGVALGTMKAISYPSADGTIVPAYLTLPPGSSGKGLPAIVMPHGGPGARDEWGFDWLAQYFAVRGYAVLQPQFRGSTGFGSAWFQKNGFQSWDKSIDDVNSAGRWLVSQGISPSDKLAIVGWSYGGYAALQSAVVDPQLFKAIVAIAPVTDFDKFRSEFSDMSNYVIMDNLIGNGPHIQAGSPARHADRFVAPVLMFHGDADRNVAVGESRLMEEKLKGAGKSVRYVEFPGLAHSLDDTAARTRMLSESDAFLRQTLGLGK
ncbi:alpha/beta hydrolase family protein [Novosphingobium album (ex Liu et al. 2023)]|uniref:S9 family peptidase n=1 Tax=Novosphingobium album (ex Liu et al. 2023) TaxID=3031130 RepID=A0ABT5WUW1_9SPHN|nr:S9 family peptidase [Novosphingobium album (ex Liu et al. 2023)]MDE8653647.1 S9 family peptidase [Novosphingobium album (ex Liu et al. 2023)]